MKKVTYPFLYIQDRVIQCHDVEVVPLVNLKCNQVSRGVGVKKV